MADQKWSEMGIISSNSHLLCNSKDKSFTSIINFTILVEVNTIVNLILSLKPTLDSKPYKTTRDKIQLLLFDVYLAVILFL
jgi:hypothetical protein